MIIVGLCLVIAVGAWWLGPRVLTIGRWQIRLPRLALALWHCALAIGLLALLTSIVIAVSLALTTTHTSDVVIGVIQTLAGWGALTALGALLLVLGVGADKVGSAGKHSFYEVLALPHTSEHLDRRTALRTCNTHEAFACAIPGREQAVVISSGMRSLLTPPQLRAVIAHEQAHLRGRHYLALRLAELNRACLPSSRAGTQLLRATALLVELIADDDAARRAGAIHLANALVHVAEHTDNASMELRAERLAERTWRRRPTPPLEAWRPFSPSRAE